MEADYKRNLDSCVLALAGHPKYDFVKSLSSGAFGVVVLCQHKATKEQVAIKFIQRGSSVSKYVELECLNHRWLKHPHVVKFKELFLTPKHICIVMEFANGGTLFQQLVIALDYCHQPGKAKPPIFNRDIKLENILLENVAGASLPLVKMCDFGYSMNGDLMSKAKSKVGTLVYMAPEVIYAGPGEKYDGKKADIWSVGVTLYIMLVGRYPFDAQGNGIGTQAVMERIKKGDWKLPPQVASTLSSECRDLLSKLMVADPAQRISMSSIMQHPWFLRNLPPSALTVNSQCLDISDYSGLQTEEEIKAILKQVYDASENVDDLIEAAIGEEEEEDEPDPFGLL